MLGGLFGKAKRDPNKLLNAEGAALPGHMNGGAPAGSASVVVIPDWFGLTPYARGVVDRFAAAGFVAFGLDLYRGKLPANEDQAEAMSNALPWSRGDGDVRATLAALKARDPNSKPCLLGFGMGGAAAVHAATQLPDVAGVVTFYGIPKSGDVAKIKARVLGHFGQKDTRCYPARVTAFEKTLKDAGIACEIHRYDAGNGFFSETKKNYSPQDASVAWDRTVAFIRAIQGPAPAAKRP